MATLTEVTRDTSSSSGTDKHRAPPDHHALTRTQHHFRGVPAKGV